MFILRVKYEFPVHKMFSFILTDNNAGTCLVTATHKSLQNPCQLWFIFLQDNYCILARITVLGLVYSCGWLTYQGGSEFLEDLWAFDFIQSADRNIPGRDCLIGRQRTVVRTLPRMLREFHSCHQNKGAQWGLTPDLTCADPSVEIGLTSHALHNLTHKTEEIAHKTEEIAHKTQH